MYTPIEQIAFYRELADTLAAVLDPEREKRYRAALDQLARETLRLLLDKHRIESGAPLCVAVVGSAGAGKSTLVNSLVGERVCATEASPTTAFSTRVRHGPELSYALVERDTGRPAPISGQRYRSLLRQNEGATETIELQVECRHPAALLRDVDFIDTPGFHDGAAHHSRLSRRAAMDADVLLVVTDVGRARLGPDEVQLLEELRQVSSPTPCFLIVTKGDRMAGPEREAALEGVRQRHGELVDACLMYSATEALDGQEAALEQRLAALADEVLRLSRNGEPFALTLKGDDGGRRFAVELGGQRFRMADAPPSSCARRGELVGLLEKLARDRGSHQQRALARRRDVLRQDGRKSVRGLRAALAAELNGLEAPRVPPEQSAALRAAMRRMRERLLALFRGRACAAARAGLSVTKVPKDEKGYWFSPFARVQFTAPRAAADTAGRAFWADVDKALHELGELTATELPQTGLAEDLRRTGPAMKASATAHLVETLRRDYERCFRDCYESVESAAAAKQAYVDELRREESPGFSRALAGPYLEYLEQIGALLVLPAPGHPPLAAESTDRERQSTLLSVVTRLDRFSASALADDARSGPRIGGEQLRERFYLLVLDEIRSQPGLDAELGENELRDVTARFTGRFDEAAFDSSPVSLLDTDAAPVGPAGAGLDVLGQLAPPPLAGCPGEELGRSATYNERCRRALLNLFWGRTAEAEQEAKLAEVQKEEWAFAYHVLGLAHGLRGAPVTARDALTKALERELLPGARERIERALRLVS